MARSVSTTYKFMEFTYMNILEIAKECDADDYNYDVELQHSECYEFTHDPLQAFAQAVIADYKASLVPVAYRTYDRNGWFNISPNLEEAMRDFPTKEHTPLYALGGTK